MHPQASALARLRPKLFHITAPDAYRGIFDQGLLSTTVLLESYGWDAAKIDELVTTPRRDYVTVEGANGHDPARLCHQRPINSAVLGKSLALTGTTESDYLRLLASRVYFFPSDDTATGFRESLLADGAVDVITLNTFTTLRSAEDRVEVSRHKLGRVTALAHREGSRQLAAHRPVRATRGRDSFKKAFWMSPFRGLADVVEGTRKDTSIRPNQIFAVSLPNSPLTPEQQSAVVEVVRRELLTPVGLRTLSRSDPNYKGRYTGPQIQRDAAYHNGTVWPWPIGAFLDAYLKVNKHSDAAKAQAREWLTPLAQHMADQGAIGQIAEIFEGDEPHRPVGCPAQAWSVAEVLRLAVELGM